MELFDMNLYEAIKDRKQYFKPALIQWYSYQLFKSIEVTHKNGIFHRDLKPENILLKDHHLVLADLGSCKGIKVKQPFTEYVSTRWYRAPECILTNGFYNYKMDIWGVGCVLFEMATLFPLFPGDNEINQMEKIQNILGPPSEAVINYYKQNSMDENTQISIDINIKGKGFERHLNHCSDLFIDLLKKLLVYHPDERLSAKQALQHPYFQDITENTYYNQYFITEKSNILSKNILNESLSMIKSVDDSQGNIQKIKNFNNNMEKMERFEKYGSNNKLSNINIMTMGSSNNIMKSINNNNNSLNKNYNSNNNNSSNMDIQHSQRNLKDSIENENSFKKEKNKIKLPKIIKAKVNNINTNVNSNNVIGTYKSNYAIIGGINFDLAKNLNNSNEYNNNIRYMKNESMSKKMNILKSKYVSPYSRKAIFNIPQKYGKQ